MEAKTIPTAPYQHGPIPGEPSQTGPTPTGDNFNRTGFLNRTSILKISQIGFSLVTVACNMFDYWYRAVYFVDFVAVSALIVAIFYLVIHSVHHLESVFGQLTFLYELIQYCVWSVLYLTAAIMSMVDARFGREAVIATAVFATGGTVAFSIDACFQIQDWRSRRTGNSELTQQAQPLVMSHHRK